MSIETPLPWFLKFFKIIWKYQKKETLKKEKKKGA